MRGFKLGDKVVRLTDNSVAEPTGTTAELVGLAGSGWLSVRITSGPRAGLFATWLKKSVALFDPIEEAKKLLESKGYKIHLPENRFTFSDNLGQKVTVTPLSVQFNDPRMTASISRSTMNKLVEAWTHVQAEEERRKAS